MNSDNVTYRAVVTATKFALTYPDSYYDSQVDTFNKYYARHSSLPERIRYIRDQQANDHNSIGKTETWNFGDHSQPGTVKAKITRETRGRLNFWRIDKVEWFVSETKWTPVDL